MRITVIAVAAASQRWPGLRTDSLAPGLNVFHGPSGSGKTTLADLAGQALFGQRLRVAGDSGTSRVGDGELIVECGGRGYRLRRTFQSTGQPRLTVAALDGSAVDRSTVRQFLGGLTPALAAPVFLSRLDRDSVETWLSEDFLQRILHTGDTAGQPDGLSRKAEFVARRDALARELEMHLADQRLQSRTLDQRWRQLDGLVREAELKVGDCRERLRAAQAATAEVDTRLRYLELEATLGHPSSDADAAARETEIIELDERIAQWRSMLAKLRQREAEIRSQVAQIRPDDESPGVTLADQRAWLAVARRWSADLQGEVARLARATETQSCVCRDAHPRLQPIVEAIVGQLETLESLVEQQQLAAQAAELGEEADDLARSQAELNRQIEHLLQRRQSAVRGAKPGRRLFGTGSKSAQQDDRWRDLKQLDERRWQLQKEHADLVDELAALEPRLRDLRTERDAADRQRAALLSTQSIDALRGQLAAVQRQLECAAHTTHDDGSAAWQRVLKEASDLLAQLTDGGLTGLQLSRSGHVPHVVNRAAQSLPLTSLTAIQRRQVDLSMCLALANVCRRQGVRLPLVLDEPFADWDAAAGAALVAVLDDLGRRGQQVLVFTGHPAAVERFAALGVTSWSMRQLQQAATKDETLDETLIDRPIAKRTSEEFASTNGPRTRKARPATGTASDRRKKPKRKRAG